MVVDKDDWPGLGGLAGAIKGSSGSSFSGIERLESIDNLCQGSGDLQKKNKTQLNRFQKISLQRIANLRLLINWYLGLLIHFYGI